MLESLLHQIEGMLVETDSSSVGNETNQWCIEWNDN